MRHPGRRGRRGRPGAAGRLARRRAGRVVLLEKAFLGAAAAASRRAFCSSTTPSPSPPRWPATDCAFYAHLHEALESAQSSRGAAWCWWCARPNRAALEANLAAQAEAGIELRPINGQELTEIDANARLADDELAAYEAEAGCVDPVQALAALAENARRHGADLRLGVEVKALEADKGKVVGVQTNEGPYTCGTVVLATGSWTPGCSKRRKARCRWPCGGRRRPFSAAPADSGRRNVVYADFAQGLYSPHHRRRRAGWAAGRRRDQGRDRPRRLQRVRRRRLAAARAAAAESAVPRPAPQLRPRRLRGASGGDAGRPADPGPAAGPGGRVPRRRLRRAVGAAGAGRRAGRRRDGHRRTRRAALDVAPLRAGRFGDGDGEKSNGLPYAAAE